MPDYDAEHLRLLRAKARMGPPGTPPPEPFPEPETPAGDYDLNRMKAIQAATTNMGPPNHAELRKQAFAEPEYWSVYL